MSTIAMQQQITPFTINIPNVDLNRFKGLAKVMGWSFEEAVVQKEKNELELSLEDVNAGKVVNVGTVDNLMKYLHS